MKWATFSRAARQHVPVKLTTVPMEDNIATQGDVLVCSPFLKELSEAELQRCSEICDWWKETQAKIGIDVDEGDAKAPVREEWQRVHRLLQDAGPDVPPSGYCDCTVEVRLTSQLWVQYLKLHFRYSLSLLDVTRWSTFLQPTTRGQHAHIL